MDVQKELPKPSGACSYTLLFIALLPDSGYVFKTKLSKLLVFLQNLCSYN